MPARSAVGQLPDEIRDELNRRLVENGFGSYAILADWLRGLGYQISKSALHRHGSALEADFDQALADVRRTRALAKACKDDGDEGDVLSATSSILQEQLLRISIALRQADTDPQEAARSISVVARAHADVGRMQVTLQKWQESMREKAAVAADAVEKVARHGGLTADSVDLIRREILGITS